MGTPKEKFEKSLANALTLVKPADLNQNLQCTDVRTYILQANLYNRFKLRFYSFEQRVY